MGLAARLAVAELLSRKRNRLPRGQRARASSTGVEAKARRVKPCGFLQLTRGGSWVHFVYWRFQILAVSCLEIQIYEA